MQPKWFQLLYEQKYGLGVSGHGRAFSNRFGLTPAFLVGALRIPPGAVRDSAGSRHELSALLESMMDNDCGELVRIAPCNNINQPIASLRGGSRDYPGDLGDAVVFSDGSPSKLYAWPDCFARSARDVVSLSDKLWTIFGAPICEGRFSYRGGIWQGFNEHDLEFIRRACEANEG